MSTTKIEDIFNVKELLLMKKMKLEQNYLITIYVQKYGKQQKRINRSFNQAMPQFWKIIASQQFGRGQFISQRKRLKRVCKLLLTSYTSKITFWTIQHRLEIYIEREIPDVQSGFRKGDRTRDLLLMHTRWLRKPKNMKSKSVFTGYKKGFWFWSCGMF